MVINEVREHLKTTTWTAMEKMFAKHPFADDNAAMLYLLVAALWELDDRKFAEMCGISLDAARFLASHMVAHAVAPELAG